MVDAKTTATFLIAVLLLLLIPGPAVLLTLTRTITGGRRVGLATALGIAAGDFAHTMLASCGLSAVLLTSTLAFNAVKFVGAAYLIILGVREILSRSSSSWLTAAYTVSASQAFRQGLATEFLNPKTALFFLAFLPQFIQSEKGPVFRQFIMLGSVIVSMSAAYMSVLALTAYKVSRWLLQHQGIGRWQGHAVGLIYITIGIRLAMQEIG